MKKDFFQRIFDRKSSGFWPSSRRLSLEALENRELLNADWGGFAPEKTTEFESTAAEYSVDFSERAPNFCELADLTGDEVDELLTINYSEKTLDVYANDGTGAYVLKKSTAIAELIDANDSPVVFGDVVGGDGIADLVVVSQSTTGAKLALSATVYQGSANYSFTKVSTTALDVSAFPSSGLAFLSLDVALRETASGADLLVQGSTLSMGSGGASPRQTLIYSGVGETDFGKSATSLNLSGSSTTDDPILTGVATIGGKECVVSIDRTSSQSNSLVLTDISATTPKKYVANLSSLGSVVVEWVVEKDGVLIVGGTVNKASAVLTLNDFVFADGNVKFTSNVVECDGMTLNASSVAAIGNMGGLAATPELFVANGSTYAVFQGETSRTYGFEFEQNGVVAATPNYHSVYVGDVDGDGATETLLVGATQITVGDAEADGSVANLKAVATFDQTAKKAVFGDFNGDGLTDVAVYYQAEGSDFTVGTNLQIFQQISNGTFAPVASRAVSGFIDFTVGSFSQAGVDEIAILSQAANSSVQYVETLRLTVASGSTTLNQTRSYRLGSLNATALTAGTIYGSGLDDVVAVNSEKNSISVLKNTGSTFSATTLTTNTGLVASGVYNPTSVAIGDINGDGLNDVVVLNAASGSNYAHIAYYLQTASGLSAVASNSSLRVSGVAPTGLVLADLNVDGKLDVATVQHTTAGKSNLFGFLGNGTTSILGAGKALGETSVGAALTVGRFNDDVSPDMILAQGKNVGVFLNTDGSESSGGSVKFVCQSASASAGANLDAALATERTWLDEWSNFYIDVWATTDGAGVVTTATAALKFNSEYFTLVGVEAATGFNASLSVANGVATVSATGKAANDGWALVARVRFAPTVDANGAYQGGLAIPQDGVITSVPAEFSAVAASQSVNGAAVATVDAPTDLVVYPVDADSTDDGLINAKDVNDFLLAYGNDLANLPSDLTFCKIFDYNNDDKISSQDFGPLLQRYGLKADGVSDSYYTEEPTFAASSAVLASEVETEEGVYSLANPSEVAAATKAARAAAVDAALVAEAFATETDDEEETDATIAVAEEAVATQIDDESADERAALVETFAAVGSATETDGVWAFDEADDEEDAFAFDVDLNVEF